MNQYYYAAFDMIPSTSSEMEDVLKTKGAEMKAKLSLLRSPRRSLFR